MTATVIVRILPGHRRQGLGSEYLATMLTEARGMAAGRIETVVLAANEYGLGFAPGRLRGVRPLQRILATGYSTTSGAAISVEAGGGAAR
jgi:hypothetical protein